MQKLLLFTFISLLVLAGCKKDDKSDLADAGVAIIGTWNIDKAVLTYQEDDKTENVTFVYLPGSFLEFMKDGNYNVESIGGYGYEEGEEVDEDDLKDEIEKGSGTYKIDGSVITFDSDEIESMPDGILLDSYVIKKLTEHELSLWSNVASTIVDGVRYHAEIELRLSK